MTTKHILLSAAMLLPVGLHAQNAAQALEGRWADPILSDNAAGRYLYDDATQLWRNTHSAAGLTLDSARNRGLAELRLQHRSGDFHRVQEGAQTNNLVFSTERYQHLGKYLYGYGRFAFDYGRTKERAWSDVMRTYNSNPFVSGSSVAGRYDFQDFDLSARVGTVELGGWRLGMGLDYKVGDLSRLRDPRSRSRLLDYRIVPSVAHTMGSHTVGLSGWYRRYKEKMPNITTVQEDPSLYYYQMTGLDAISGTIGGYKGFSREYVNHDFGAELQYGYRSEGVSSVTTASIERGTEHVLEQYKREPGRYYTYIYKVASQNRIVGHGLVHGIDAGVRYGQGYADEYRPTLVITTDSVHGYTSQRYDNLFTYKKRYQLTTLEADLHYRLNFVEGAEVRSYVGVQGHLSAVSQKHLLPTSTFDLTGIDLWAEYGRVLGAAGRLWAEVATGYHIASKTQLDLANGNSLYARSVLVKDLNYYDKNYWTGHLSVMYQFPLTVKGYRSMWYVKAYGEMTQAQHGMHRNTVGMAVGLFN